MKTKNIFIILGICLIVGFIAAALTTNFVGDLPIQYETGQDTHSFTYNQDLRTISTEDWETILNQKTIDDAVTNCYGHTFDNGKHTLYCDKIAGSDTELGFKTYFKTDVTDYKITELKEVTKSYTLDKIVGSQEIICPKDSLNKTCYEPIIEKETHYYTEIIETPLSILKELNDWSITYKRDFIKDEKRTYKIEWKDKGPNIISKIIQGTKDIGKVVYPQISYFMNEIKINPNITITNTTAEWNAEHINQEVDAGGNIGLETIPGVSEYEPTQPNWINTTNDDWNRLEELGAGAGWIYQWIPSESFEFNNNTIFEFGAGDTDNGECDGTVRIDVKFGDTVTNAYNNASTYATVDVANTVWGVCGGNCVQIANATGWTMNEGASTIPAGENNLWVVLVPPNNNQKCRITATAIMGDSIARHHGTSAAAHTKDPQFAVYNLETGADTYKLAGNSTSEWNSPYYPDPYNWRTFNATTIDADADTNVTYYYQYSSDNSTNVTDWLEVVNGQNINLDGYSSWRWRASITTSDNSKSAKVSMIEQEYFSTIAPTLDLIHPANTTYYVDPVPINVSTFDAEGIDSLYYAIDDGTNTTINYPANATESLSQGSYKIQIYVNDSSGLENTTTQYFYVNTPPTIPIPISPANNSFHTSLPALTVNESYDVDTLEYYFEVDDSPAFDSVDEGSGFITATPTTISWTPTTLSESGWYWRALSNDGTTNSSWSNVSYFTYDNTVPVVEEAYNLTDMATYVLPVISEWNFTSSDVNQDKCYYNTTDNGTLTYVTCNDASYYTTSWATGGLKTVRYCSNDSAGLETCRTSNLKVYSISDPQHASHTSIGEGDTVTFTLYVNLTGIVSEWTTSTANLTINGTEYTTNRYDDTNFMRFTKELTVPGTWGNSTGHPYNWSFHYEIKNSTDSLQTKAMSNDTLTVYEIAVDDCSVHSTRIINYTLYDEETRTNTGLTNQSIETDITLAYGSTNIYEYSTSTALNNSLEICISNDVLNFTAYTLGAVTRYSADDHVVEFHYFDDYALSNSSMQTVNLYDLWSTTARDEYSTSFLINYQDENYLPVEGAIIDLLRYYVGDGIYLSVENARTDADGNTRLHFVTEDVKYKAIVRVNNEIVYTTPEFLALCQSTPCQINLQKESDITPVGDYEHTDNLQYNIVLDTDTREVTLTYATQNGVSADMELNVTRWDAYFNDTICNEAQSSSGGTLTCTVPGTYTNMTYFVDVYKDGEFVAQRFFDLNPNPQDTFGNTGLILSGIIYLTCVLLAISGGGVSVLIFAILGIVLASALALFNGGGVIGVGSAIMWFIVAVIVMLVKIAKRRGS